MQRYFTAGALCAIAMALLPTSAGAFEVSVDQTLCPMQTVGEDEINSWSVGLGSSQGQMSDAQSKALQDAVRTCADAHDWSASDEIAALEFNVSIIVATAIEDKLSSDGVVASDYEVVLDDQSAAELQQILDDPDNSPAMTKLTEMVISELGDDLTAEIAGDIGAYVGFMAHSQLSAMKLMGIAD